MRPPLRPLRPLHKREITALRAARCRAADWRAVTVAPGFTPDAIRDTEFSGEVTLGAHAAIERAALHNIDIGDNVAVRNTRFAGQTAERSPFAHGARAHCLAEDGARSVPLRKSLSAQWAHLLLHYKNSPVAETLERLLRDDSAAEPSARSRIGEGAVIDGADALTNIHVNSTESAPVRIGGGVAADTCIFQQGADVAGGVRLAHCLVGEGARLANGFFAEHSLFFANADFALGEALAVMAGPFAVSHHRATLVLACQTSFSNFGSGANSSNHRFKLGPRHGGVLRRGVRCGSGSYLLWPSDIGAFTTVIGRHARGVDTAAFPFSLLTAEGGESVLVPGVNLFTAGLFRDERKWRARDRRAGIAAPLDLYETNILTPYTMEAAERGLDLLRRHKTSGGGDLLHNGARIPAARVDAGIALYEKALTQYLGRTLPENETALPVDIPPQMPWRDWGGLPVSGARAEAFLQDAVNGVFADADAVTARFREMHAAFREDERLWAASRFRTFFGNDMRLLRRQFREAEAFAFARRMRDAEKEFSPESRYGFGVEEPADEAFRRIRGVPKDDPVVQEMIKKHERLMNYE